MRRVAFQGECGAYSEAAAVGFFDDEVKTVPYRTFGEALSSTEKNETDYSILPVENSLEGSVGESTSLLYATQLHAVGETYHKIEHCLIGTGTIDEVKTVYSHPQALGQCRKFMQERSIKTVPTYDTAGSVKIIKELNRKDVACIASKGASEIHGVPVIRAEIADMTNNHTRFLILAKDESRGGDKTSIIFSIKHEPGALFRIIRRLYDGGVNMTKIESRPKRDKAWEYNFYIDFEGDKDDPGVADILQGIKTNSLFFKILGSYRAAQP